MGAAFAAPINFGGNMIDKIKPLKIETAIDGTQTDPFPTEANPAQDYVAAKGVSFENSDEYYLSKIGRIIESTSPNGSMKVSYNSDGLVSTVEYFEGATQTTPERIAMSTLTYDIDLLPTLETIEVFDADGTTVLRTISNAFEFSDFELVNMEVTTS